MNVFGGRYQVQDQLGAGGMGTVYRAQDLQNGELVAVKVLKRDVQNTVPDAVERFNREADALRRLNHPNIVKVLNHFEDNNQHYIVMEYVQGGTLYDLLRDRGRLSAVRALEISLDLADALTRAHRLRIVHRDLKPANVLIADDGSPRLTDFGVAHMGARERVTQTGAAIGTLDYMSPEALNSLPVDERTDIWSFGVMLFEMLTGHRPFTGDNLTATITAILTQPPPDLEALRPDLPLALTDLVYRMLNKEREARLASVRVLGAELEALLNGNDNFVASSLIWVQRESGDTRAFDRFNPSTPGSQPLHNLPAHTSPFIGRETEQAELKRLLSEPDNRLVTIVGPGGMGKTRLALQVAEGQLGRYPHGVYLVQLAPLSDPAAVIPAVADAVGYTFSGDDRSEVRQLLDYLREKRALLILDNFEHVLDSAAFVGDLLTIAPDVTVLATSRERLNLSAEVIYTLGGMDFPAWETPADAMQYSAVQLFMQGARRAQPGFQLTPEALPYVARICRLVDGLPLAILLAAAWVDSLTPGEIADELMQNYDFLDSNLRDLPERHRSIRAVFDYSWRLMNANERRVFARLSVFRDGFDREAARQVTGASLRDLNALVNKSLVRRDPETGRYTLHMLLHQYAAEALAGHYDDASVLQRAHAEYFAAMLHKLEDVVVSYSSSAAIDAVDNDIENVRAAWAWAVNQQRWPMIEQMLDTLDAFYAARSLYSEGIARFAALASLLPADQQRLVWRLRARQARMLDQTGHYDEAWALDEPALAYFVACDDPAEMQRVLNSMAYVSMMQGQYQEARDYAEKASFCAAQIGADIGYVTAQGHLGYIEFLRGNFDAARDIYSRLLAREGISPANRAFGLNNLGEVLLALGEVRQAGKLFEESHQIFKAYRNRRGMAFTLKNLAGVHVFNGDYASALAIYREAYDLYREVGDRSGIAHSLSALGNAAAYAGQYTSALEMYEQALALRREIGDPRGQADSLSDLGDAALMMEQYPLAERYFRESLAIRQDIGDAVGATETLVWLSVTLAIGSDDTDAALAALDAARAQAAQLNVPYLFALIAISYGEMYLNNAQYDEAWREFEKGLMLGIETGLKLMLIFPLVGLASLLARADDVQQQMLALELVVMLQGLPRTMMNFYYDRRITDLAELLAALLPEDAIQSASERGSRRDLSASAREMLSAAHRA